jgi:hypothetical protein
MHPSRAWRPEERDEYLRGVVAELFEDNGRWPGLWSRLQSLLSERDRLASEVGHQAGIVVTVRDDLALHGSGVLDASETLERIARDVGYYLAPRHR